MAKGRKRKAGKREANGRLQRIGQRDKGTDRAALKFSVYGTDGSDAIGRAYRMGLLGEDADNLLIAARRIFADYWPMMGHGVERCSLGDRTGGAMPSVFDPAAHAALLEVETRLTQRLRSVDALGRSYRRAFDGLVIDINPDYGPAWLDRLIAQEGSAQDRDALDKALHALRAVCS